MKIFILSLFATLCSLQQLAAQLPGKIANSNQVMLPNGWKISPAGRSIDLGDLPLNMQLSASGKLLAVTNNGQSTQSVQLIDPKTEKILDEKVLTKAWYGLAFSKDDKHLYVSGGNDNWILNFEIKENKLAKIDTIKLGQIWPKAKISPAGIAVNRANTKLYTVTKEDSCLYIINPLRLIKFNYQLSPTLAFYLQKRTNFTSPFGVEKR